MAKQPSPMPCFLSVLCSKRQTILPTVSEICRHLFRGAFQYCLLCPTYHDDRSGLRSRGRRLRAHLWRRSHIQQPYGANRIAIKQRTKTFTTDETQSWNFRYFWVWFWRLYTRKLRSTPAHKRGSSHLRMSDICMIAAAAENNALGKDNELLWHLPLDFKRFKALTTGHPMIMGRKTFESFPKPSLTGNTWWLLETKPTK